MKNPCFNCKDRYVGCHSECEAYTRWSKYNTDISSKRRKENEAAAFANNIAYTSLNKTRKRKER